MAAAPKCEGCGHRAHRDQCKAKGRSRCVTAATPDANRAWMCGMRPPCPCPFGTCHTCGAPIAGVTVPGADAIEVDVERGSAGAPDGTMTVRKAPDGISLIGRLLKGNQDPLPREWRGRVHAHQLPEAAAWLDAQQHPART